MDSKLDSDSDSSVEENKRMPDEDFPFKKVQLKVVQYFHIKFSQ